MPNPGKIVCVGLNYRKHAEETGAAIPESPVLFSKFTNTVAAAKEEIPLSDAATQYDYEVELAVVMGDTAKDVAQGQALAKVFGYAMANDISARELQTRTSQWLLGKTMDKFMPIGPYLVTADAVPDPQALPVRTWLNGELRQNSNTSDMIFPVAETHFLHQSPFHARSGRRDHHRHAGGSHPGHGGKSLDEARRRGRGGSGRARQTRKPAGRGLIIPVSFAVLVATIGLPLRIIS